MDKSPSTEKNTILCHSLGIHTLYHSLGIRVTAGLELYLMQLEPNSSLTTNGKLAATYNLQMSM